MNSIFFILTISLSSFIQYLKFCSFEPVVFFQIWYNAFLLRLYWISCISIYLKIWSLHKMTHMSHSLPMEMFWIFQPLYLYLRIMSKIWILMPNLYSNLGTWGTLPKQCQYGKPNYNYNKFTIKNLEILLIK